MKKVSLICVFALMAAILCSSVAFAAIPSAGQVNSAIRSVSTYANGAIPNNYALGAGIAYNQGYRNDLGATGAAVNMYADNYKVLGIGAAVNTSGAFNDVNALGAGVLGASRYSTAVGVGVAWNDGGWGNTLYAEGASIAGNGFVNTAIGLGVAYNAGGERNNVSAVGAQIQGGSFNTAYGVGIAINDGNRSTVSATGAVVFDPN